jgi:hypothetical protein
LGVNPEVLRAALSMRWGGWGFEATAIYWRSDHLAWGGAVVLGRWCFLLLVVPLLGCSKKESPVAPAQTDPGRSVKQKITEPDPADMDQLAKREAVVLGLLKERYPEATINHGEDDLEWLQRLVDDKALRADQTYELQCLGAVLGQVFAANTPLKWVVVEGPFGRDLALQYPNTTVIVFPMTMISKRVEDGRDVDLVPLYRTVAAQVEKMKDNPDYKR